MKTFPGTSKWKFLRKKLSRTNGILSKLRYYVSKKNFKLSLLQPFTLVCSIWLYSLDLHVTKNIMKVLVLQKKRMRLLTLPDYREHTSPIFKSLKVLKF